MAIPFLNNITLNNNEIQNVKLHNTANIASPSPGHIYFDTDDSIAKYWDGSSWVDIVSNTNDFLTGLSFNTADGVLTATVQNQSNVTVDLDGRYALASDIPATIVESVTGGTYITNSGTAADVVLDHDATSRTDTTSTDTPTYGGTFEAVTSVTTNATGHVTAIDVSTVTIPANVDEDVTVSNLITRLGEISENVTIGDASDVTVIIPGDLQVTGTTTTNNVETVSTSNGVIFEGNAADDNELTLLAGTLTSDRTITLPDATGTVALIDDISDDTITITAGSGLTGGGTFTLNGSATEITVSHEDTSSQASVDNSGRTYIQDITLDTYGHVTGITSATETVVNTDNQLATAAALIDVSAMGANTTASFTHSLASKNLIVQMYDVTTGEVVFADVDHTSINAISIIFAQTPTNDIRVVVIDAKNDVSDSTVTYS